MTFEGAQLQGVEAIMKKIDVSHIFTIGFAIFIYAYPMSQVQTYTAVLYIHVPMYHRQLQCRSIDNRRRVTN